MGIKKTFRLIVEPDVHEHLGLGTGTQLGLAVARAIAELTWPRSMAGLPAPSLDAVTLPAPSRAAARAPHSACMAFKSAGSSSRGAKLRNRKFRPCWFGASFPRIGKSCSSLRRIRSAYMADAKSMHSPNSSSIRPMIGRRKACAGLCCSTCCRRLWSATGAPSASAVRIQSQGGELFRLIQGSCTIIRMEELVKTVRDFGIKGVGQSSWGPTIFAEAPDEGPNCAIGFAEKRHPGRRSDRHVGRQPRGIAGMEGPGTPQGPRGHCIDPGPG